VPYDRDVGAFDARSAGYEHGWRGRLHHDIVDIVVDMALRLDPAPRRVLDVGCGTGYLLRRVAGLVPDADSLVGVDPAPGMVSAAAAAGGDARLAFHRGTAETLPFPDATFDLVVATTSFDHWEDQAEGVRQIARVTAPGGHFVLADLLSMWMLPSVVTGPRRRVRTRRGAIALLATNGFQVLGHRHLFVVLQAVSARRT